MAGEKYDSTYKKGVFFGKRSAAITQILKYVKVPGRALDLGVGQGRTFVPLLKEGFSGVGVDESSVGIKDFLKYAQEEGVDCEGVCCDIVEYKFKEDFDIIISMFTLQFLDGFDVIRDLIIRMKKHTKVGGVHFLSVPTAGKTAVSFSYHFDDKDALAALYVDWEILLLNEKEGPFKNGNMGTSAYLLARRKA